MSCENCLGVIGKSCDRSKDRCGECVYLIGALCCIPCCTKDWKKDWMSIAYWLASCVCIWGVPIIFCFLTLNCFWLAAVLSQTGTCKLVIWYTLPCGYFTMFLEVLTFVAIIALPLLFMVCCLSVTLMTLAFLWFYCIIGAMQGAMAGG